LEAAALELYPELAELRRAIVEAGHANVCMAGSGSTFFVAHQTRVECVEALVSLAALRRRGVDLVQTESGPEQHREPASAPYPGPAGN
jgi:4-diphosphocytidyl-2C-methyl-D-erythritol kinase